ncbi:MAG: metallophosphoesterase family protein [Alphaproteobacteria bacterium]
MFWKKKAPAGTTIFFCSDIHASTVCFRKFLNAARHYRKHGVPIDVLIVGGDITGKLIVPIVRTGPEAYRSYLYGREFTLGSPAELADLIRKTETLGVYPHVFEPDEYEAFKVDPATQDRLFRALALKRLEEWMSIAVDKLDGTDVRCFVSPGNDDFDECVDVIARCPVVECPDLRIVDLAGGHEMINLGYANLTPFHCPRDLPEDELGRRIDAMAGGVRDMANCVFNLHVPPLASGLDDAPLLDENLRPKIGTTGVAMAPVGSTAVRAAVERYQPLLGLHGHIHESRGALKLGRTLCVNPGSEYSEGILHGALVTIRQGEVVRHMLTMG